MVIPVSSSFGTGRPLLRRHLCVALRSCAANVVWSGSTLDFPENSKRGTSGATLHSSMAMCPSCRLSGDFSLNGLQVQASGCSGCHRRCASLQLMSFMVRCFVNTNRVEGMKHGVIWSLCLLFACLRKVLKFDVKLGCISGCAKIGLLGFGVCRRLFRRTTFKAFCAACLWTLDRLPAMRRSP